jgi:hypothetical protein
VVKGGGGAIVFGAASLAALVLTHNITAMLFTPVAVAYGIVIGWDVRGAGRRLAACALLGLALSAFFWLPALAERRLVRMEDVVADRYQYQQNFASLSHLWDITGEVSTPLTEDGVHLTLGGLQILLALPSLWMLASAGAHRRRILFFWLLLAAGLCMTLSFSRPIWAALPPLRYVQFPWRLMGLCTLSLACLAGAGLEAVLAEGEKWRNFRPLLPLAGVALAAPSLVAWLNKSGTPTTLPLLGLTLALAAALYLASQQKVASHLAARGVVSLFCLGLCALFFLGRGERGPLPTELPRSQLTSSGWLTWERRSGFVGTTIQGEYLPRSASRQPLPPAEQRLRSVSADGVTVRTIRSWSTGLKAEVTAHKQEMLVFEQFYFPGWHAWVDDRLVRVSLGSEGLISLSVPPGSHQVEVRFGPTAVRLWATLASYLALAAAALLIAGRRRR